MIEVTKQSEERMDDDTEFEKTAFEPVEETEEDLCRALWLAVLIQAVIDATGKAPNSLEEAKAREWLEGRGDLHSNFATVCDLAGVDFEKARKRFSPLVTGSAEKIDFRCMKRASMKNRNRNRESRSRYFSRAQRNARLRRERLRALHLAQMITGTSKHDNDNTQQQPMEKMNESETSKDFPHRWNQGHCVGQ